MEKDEFRDWLKRHELTQAAAGELLGVERLTVWSWCDGRRNITGPINNLCAAIDFLGPNGFGYAVDQGMGMRERIMEGEQK